MMRVVKDILAIICNAVAEIFDYLAKACEEQEEVVLSETTSNGRVKATLHESEEHHGT